MNPKELFFTKGIGRHKDFLASFEAALRDAGIEAQNLVTVSSIFPPDCKEISRKDGLKKLKPGQITFCVMARNASNEPNRRISAAIGMAIPSNKSHYGYLCLSGNTLIDTPYKKVPLKDLVNETDFPIYSYDMNMKQIVISRVCKVFKTHENKKLWKLVINNGREVLATPEHQFLMRDGTYKCLKDLCINDSMMPFYRLYSNNEVNEPYIKINDKIIRKECQLISEYEFYGKTLPYEPTDSELTDKTINSFGNLKFYDDYKVISIEKDVCIEDVYCMEVLDTHNFVIDAGIISKNSEHHPFGDDEKTAGEYAEDLAATMLASTLGIDFDANQAWNEREQVYKQSGKIFKSRNITTSAKVDKSGMWTTVIAVAVFII